MAGVGSRVSDVTNAAIDALVADATLKAALGGTAKVYSHVPEDTVPPYVVVLGGQELPWVFASQDDTGRDVELEVVAVSAYRGTKEVDALINLALLVITDPATYGSVSGFALVRFDRNSRPLMQMLEGRVWYERHATARLYLE